MTPVYQTRFAPEGNCFAACIATITGFPLESIPSILKMDNWGDQIRAWASWVGWEMTYSEEHVAGYSIAVGKSPRGDFPHAMVYLNGEPVFDPYPGYFGLEGDPEYFFKLTKL